MLPARLAEWQGRATRTPVLDLLLFEGHARLSHFEDALEPASRLAALYPGDGDLARRVLSLQRSLASLDPGAGAAAAALVARTTPALVDPAPLWTELGEMEYERGRPDLAKDAWRHILDRSPRDPERISQLATVLWDYGEMDDALATIEDARRRLSRPSLLAFEAGVLHEEKAAIEPAVREYLNAGLPEESECFCSAFERDQRALRRLSQLIGRERVRGIVEARIAALQPGVTPDEETLVTFYPLTTIRMPDAGLDWTADDWIDTMDHPVDPVAQAQRKDDRERWRATMREGQQRLAGALLARTKVLVAAASRSRVPRRRRALESALARGSADARGRGRAHDRGDGETRGARHHGRGSDYSREMALARYLFEKGRRVEADEAWKSIASRVGTLPEGAPRMRAEAERSGVPRALRRVLRQPRPNGSASSRATRGASESWKTSSPSSRASAVLPRGGASSSRPSRAPPKVTARPSSSVSRARLWRRASWPRPSAPPRVCSLARRPTTAGGSRPCTSSPGSRCAATRRAISAGS